MLGTVPSQPMAATLRQASRVYSAGAPRQLTYKRLTPQYKDAALACIAESFTDKTSQEPFSWVMNLKQHHWKTMAGIFVERAASQNLSLIAVNKEDDSVHAVMLNEDWKEPPPMAFKGMASEWRPVRAAFNEVHTRFKSSQTFIEPGQLLHTLYFSCVRPELRGQGVMTNLFNHSIKVAQDNNFCEMCADTSSESVAKVAAALGFDVVSTLSYKDWMFDGVHVFEELPQHKEGWFELATHKRKVPSDMYI